MSNETKRYTYKGYLPDKRGNNILVEIVSEKELNVTLEEEEGAFVEQKALIEKPVFSVSEKIRRILETDGRLESLSGTTAFRRKNKIAKLADAGYFSFTHNNETFFVTVTSANDEDRLRNKKVD